MTRFFRGTVVVRYLYRIKGSQRQYVCFNAIQRAEKHHWSYLLMQACMNHRVKHVAELEFSVGKEETASYFQQKKNAGVE